MRKRGSNSGNGRSPNVKIEVFDEEAEGCCPSFLWTRNKNEAPEAGPT